MMQRMRHPRLAARMLLLLLTCVGVLLLFSGGLPVDVVDVLYIVCLLGISGFVIY